MGAAAAKPRADPRPAERPARRVRPHRRPGRRPAADLGRAAVRPGRAPAPVLTRTPAPADPPPRPRAAPPHGDLSTGPPPVLHHHRVPPRACTAPPPPAPKPSPASGTTSPPPRPPPRRCPHLQLRPPSAPAVPESPTRARASTGIRDSGASTSTCPGPSYAWPVAVSYQRPRGSRTARRSAPRSSTGATSSASPSRNASSQSRSVRSSGEPHHSGRTYGAPVSRARCASVTKYGRSRSRSSSAALACARTSGPNSHGSRRPASIAAVRTEQRQIRAELEPAQIQLGRRGLPSNPPTSGPEYGTPHSPSPSTSESEARSPGQPVATSPDQVPPYLCMPAQPEREKRNGRSAGPQPPQPLVPGARHGEPVHVVRLPVVAARARRARAGPSAAASCRRTG